MAGEESKLLAGLGVRKLRCTVVASDHNAPAVRLLQLPGDLLHRRPVLPVIAQKYLLSRSRGHSRASGAGDSAGEQLDPSSTVRFAKHLMPYCPVFQDQLTDARKVYE
jgi:hypothetical protein